MSLSKRESKINKSTQLKQKIDPFVQQISESTTEAPKYWKNVNSAPVDNIRNVVKRKREKGEQYSDRHNQKLMAKSHRAQRLKYLKTLY